MSYNKFINNSYCVGGKHYSPTTNIRGDITNTGMSMGRPVKILRGNCTTCKRNKSLIVSDQTINGEGLGDFFKHLGSAAKNVGKKILNIKGRALEIAANIGTAAASKNPRMIAATAPTLLNLFIKGRGYTKRKGFAKARRVKRVASQVEEAQLRAIATAQLRVEGVKACIWGKSTSYIH